MLFLCFYKIHNNLLLFFFSLFKEYCHQQILAAVCIVDKLDSRNLTDLRNCAFASLATMSKKMLNSHADIRHPCLTPCCISKLSVSSPSTHTLASYFSYVWALTAFRSPPDTPYFAKVCHNSSYYTLYHELFPGL